MSENPPEIPVLPDDLEPDPGTFTGCLWPVAPSCLTGDWDELSDEEKVRYVALASSSLQGLLANRVTNCPITVRPCPPGCGCSIRCFSCESGCELRLPFVGRLDSVKVDGQELPLSDFRVDDSSIIVYEGDGPCPFTGPQDLSKRDTEAGTFSISFLPGHPVDSNGAQAVATLAMEFAKACKDGGRGCKLPSGVVSVARFGMNYEVEAGLFVGGVTGVKLVDAYIEAWNPQHRRTGSTVYSPDLPRLRYQGA